MLSLYLCKRRISIWPRSSGHWWLRRTYSGWAARTPGVPPLSPWLETEGRPGGEEKQTPDYRPRTSPWQDLQEGAGTWPTVAIGPFAAEQQAGWPTAHTGKAGAPHTRRARLLRARVRLRRSSTHFRPQILKKFNSVWNKPINYILFNAFFITL